MLLWSFFTVMPGMLVLISPRKRFWGQVLGFSLSHNSGLSIRMSVCLFWCCLIKWFKLFCLSLFLVRSWSLLCSGWSGRLFIFSAWVRSFACLLLSRGSTTAVFFHHCNWSTFHVLRPIFWTRSSLLVCVLASLNQALAPYSNVGLTAPVYTVLIILELASQCVPASFFSRANFLILLLPFHQFVVSMTDVGPVLLLEKMVFLLGVVFCLQASEWSFPWELLGRKLSLVSLFCWSEDPTHLSTAVFLWQLLESCRLQM